MVTQVSDWMGPPPPALLLLQQGPKGRCGGASQQGGARQEDEWKAMEGQRKVMEGHGRSVHARQEDGRVPLSPPPCHSPVVEGHGRSVEGYGRSWKSPPPCHSSVVEGHGRSVEGYGRSWKSPPPCHSRVAGDRVLAEIDGRVERCRARRVLGDPARYKTSRGAISAIGRPVCRMEVIREHAALRRPHLRSTDAPDALTVDEASGRRRLAGS